MKFKDLIYLLNGDFDIIDNETDNIGAKLCLERKASFIENSKIKYDSTLKFTKYGKDKFSKILNSEVIGISNVGCQAIMLDCDFATINDFLNACSGNINKDEFDRIFKSY